MRFLRWYAWSIVALCLFVGAFLFEVWREGGALWPVVIVWLYGSFSLAVAMAPVVRHPERFDTT